jgi:hypothetical protein
MLVMLPFPPRAAESNVDLKLPWAQFEKMGLQALRGSFSPQDWWVTTVYGSADFLDKLALLRHWGQIGIFVAAVYLLLVQCAGGYRHYRALLVYDVVSLLVGWAALLVITVDHYWGSARHHVFFSIPLVVLVMGWAASVGQGTLRWSSHAALPLLAPWLLFHWIVFVRCVQLDVDMPFSDTKAAAAMLPDDAHLVVDSMRIQEGYAFWKPHLVTRGQDQGGRHLGYQANDSVLHMTVAAAPLVRAECRDAPDRTYFSGWSWAVGPLERCLHLVLGASPHSEQTRPDEHFDLLQVDCACVARVN